MPNNELCSYLLVISPPDAAMEKIMKLKRDFYWQYKTVNALNKAHITLCTFAQYKTAESRIITRLRSVAEKQKEIVTELSQFGSFPSHTIYINVASRLPVLELVKGIRQTTQRLLKPDKDHKPFFISEPHLTICKGLTNQQYEESWKALRHQHFNIKFTVQSMILLRKEEDGKYQCAERFIFKNRKINVVQGLLF